MNELKFVFLIYFFLLMEGSGSEQIIMGPDPGRPKTYGSGSGSHSETGTLLNKNYPCLTSSSDFRVLFI
jgi:hypothetical protein